MSRDAKRKNRIRRCILSALLVMYTCQQSVLALPQGGTVTHGSADLSVDGSMLTIQQGSASAIINYDSFNIAGSETVLFMQPDASASALNRVMGSGRSEIEGALLANGQIYLINPNGILFSSSARVDVGGLVASAMNMSDDDFLAGRMQFAGGDGDVINHGTISAGFAYLVGRNVENHGTINAGRVALAAGDYSVLIDEAAGGTIELIIDDVAAGTSSSNAVATVPGEEAGAGSDTDFPGEDVGAGVNVDLPGEDVGADLEAASDLITDDVVADVTGQIGTTELESTIALPPSILNEGIINSSGDIGGQIAISGANINQMGTIQADGITGDGGTITLLASDTVLLGEDSVTTATSGTSGTGGEITIQGERIGHFGRADVSGTEGSGGRISLRADEVVLLGSQSVLAANSERHGDGGNILIFSPGIAASATGSRIEARGGSESGDGGFVELSGLQYVEARGSVNTSAESGNVGTYLIDPGDIEIRAGVGPNSEITWDTIDTFQPDSGNAAVSILYIGDIGTGGTLLGELANNNIIISTANAAPGIDGFGDGNITVVDAIDYDGIGGTQTLTLQADNDIIINAGIDDSTAGDGDSLNLNLQATGNISLGAGVNTRSGTFTSSGVDFDITAAGSLNTGGGAVTVDNTGDIAIGGAIDATGAGLGNVSFTAANLFGSTAAISSSGDILISSETTAFHGDLTTGGDLTVNSGGSVDFSGVATVGGNLAVDTTANSGSVGGAITDAGAGQLQITGTATLDAGDQSVTLDNAANDFGGNVIVAASSGVTIDDANAIQFGTVNTGAGNLDIGAAGTVTFNGVATVGGNLAVDTDANGGTGGAITDAGAGQLLITGTATLDAGDQAVALDNAANDFGGNVSVAQADLGVTLADANDLNLDTITTVGNVNMTSVGAVNDGNGAAVNVVGNILTIDAGTGIDLNTDVDSIEFSAGGHVYITETDGVTVAGQTTANNGLINISTTTGTLTVGVVGVSTGLVAHGSGNIDLQNAVISGVNVTTTTGNITFTGLTATDTGAVQIGSGGGAIGFGGTLDLGGDLALMAGTGSVSFGGNVTGNNFDLSIDAPVTIVGNTVNGGLASGLAVFTAQQTTLGEGTTDFASAYAFDGATTLAADWDLTATGDITFANTLNGAQDLTLTAGTGNIDLQGAVGGVNRLGAVDIVSANNVTLNALTAASLRQQAGTGTTTLNGAVDADAVAGVQLTGQDLAVNAGITTTGGGVVTLDQAGTLTIAAAGDIDADGVVGLTADGGISTAGDVTTTGDDVTYASATTLTGPVAISTGAGAGDITFTNTLNGAQDLTLTAGTGNIDLQGAVGGTSALKNLDVSGAGISFADDVTVTELTTLEATTGAITQSGGIITSSNLALRASTGIGGPGAAALSINVNELALDVTNGSAYISEQDGVIIGSVDGLTGAIASSNVKIESGTSGAGNLVVGAAVTATAGDVLLDSQNGDLVVDAPVTAVTNATLLASGGITQNADVEATAGDLYVNAVGGSITMADGTTGTAGGNVLYLAATNVTLGGVSGDNVRIEATAGSIIDGGDSDLDVSAVNAQLVAGGSVGGAGTNALDTAVGTLAASAGTGSIYVSEANGLVIGSVAIDVRQVQMDSTAPVQASFGLQGAGAAQNLQIVSGVSGAGNLVVSNRVTATAGDVLLDSRNGDLRVGAAVTAGTNATLLASSGITQSVTGDARATAGDLYVNAAGGSITMADGRTGTAGGNIRYAARDSVALGHLNATGVASRVSVIAQTGDITDANGDTSANITADAARLWAGGSIGAGGGTQSDSNPAAVDIAVNRIEAYAGTSVYLQSDRAVEVGNVGDITTSYARFDSGTSTSTDLNLVGIEADAGVAKLVSAGSVTNSEEVTAGTDALLLTSTGDVTLLADLSAGRHASVIAAGGIMQNANIKAKAGDVYIDAQGGSVNMATGAVSTAGGNILYTAQVSVVLGHLNAASGDVLVRADNGSITSAGGTVNITAEGVQLQAANGGIGEQGGNGSILLAADQLAANSRNGQFIEQIAAGGNLEVGTVAAFNVNRVRFGSGITSVPVDALGGLTSSGSIELRVDGGSLTISSPVDAGQAVNLVASASINQNEDITAVGNVNVVAQNGSIRMAGNTETRSTTGDIRYTASRNINFASLVSNRGSVNLDAGNALVGGSIDAFDSIAITASSLSMDQLKTQNNLSLNLTGDLDLDVIDVARQLDLDAGGQARVGALTVGGAADVNVGRGFSGQTMQLGSGNLRVGGGLDYSTIRSGNLVVDAGSMSFNSLTAPTINARTGGNINMGTVNAQTATFAAGGAIVDNSSMLNVNSLTMSAGRDIGSKDSPIKLNVPNINRITSGGDIYLVQQYAGLSSLGLISAGGGFNIAVPNGGFRNGNGGEINLQAGSTSWLSVHDTVGTWSDDNPIRIDVRSGQMNINSIDRFVDPADPARIWMVFGNGSFLPNGDVYYEGESEIPGLVIYNNTVIAGGREILRELYRTQAYAVENPELKSRQGVFGSPLFITGLTMVSEPIESDTLATQIESVFTIETDGF